ncbi:uncharacterized protein LOC122076750 isoform X2 [Macadamia integrifolia]|uniref:uncharacterized protein LOC122076750 isoform X2 n=1 Tax=Macadamia integrifolia TaxID=60698 RepID=UPI001C4EB0FA|nr:uncharacterized protein LOC122076750 isoform X2 [Macadamia integrifolia]
MASLMPPPPPPPQPPLYDLEMRIDVSSFTDSPPLSLQSLGKNLEALKNQKRKASALENLELGKTLLGLAFPAATGLVGLISQGTTNQHLLLLQLLTTGFAISFGVSFMAVLLRQSYPRIANADKGVSSVDACLALIPHFIEESRETHK